MSKTTAILLKLLNRNDAEGFNRVREEASGEDVSLAGKTFKSLQLVGFDFTGVDLSNTEWEHCMLDRVSFVESQLEGAYLHGTTFIGCKLIDCNVEGFSMEGCVLRRCQIEGGSFDDSEIVDTQFRDCELRDLTLTDVEWSTLTINGGKVELLVGSSGTLRGCTFREVELVDVDWGALAIEHSSMTPFEGQDVPEGFTTMSGRRKRV